MPCFDDGVTRFDNILRHMPKHVSFGLFRRIIGRCGAQRENLSQMAAHRVGNVTIPQVPPNGGTLVSNVTESRV
jgi:hypothetical protein